MREFFRDALGHCQSHSSAETMPNQDYAVQIFGIQNRNDILNVSIQINVRISQMGPLAQTRERHGIDFMSCRPQ